MKKDSKNITIIKTTIITAPILNMTNSYSGQD